MLITYVLRMDTVLHQSCKIWLLSEICREFLNDGPLSCIEVNRFYKNDKPCLLTSLLLQRTLSLQEFQYTLHDPENTELVYLVLVHFTCSHRTQTTDWFCSLSWKEGSTVPRNSCTCIQFSHIVLQLYGLWIKRSVLNSINFNNIRWKQWNMHGNKGEMNDGMEQCVFAACTSVKTQVIFVARSCIKLVWMSHQDSPLLLLQCLCLHFFQPLFPEFFQVIRI